MAARRGWHTWGLQPHRVETAKFSTDPQLEAEPRETRVARVTAMRWSMWPIRSQPCRRAKSAQQIAEGPRYKREICLLAFFHFP